MKVHDVLEVLAALEHEGVDYALFGGVAMAAMKRDTVRPRDADDASRLRRAFGLED